MMFDDDERRNEPPAARAEAAPDVAPNASTSASALPDRASAFYNALQTEHFVLESARSITVSESSSRASLYLMTLSSSLIAFGFLAKTDYATAFLGVVLPVIVLLGVFTYERLVETSLEDVVALASIQRIRRYYASLLPGAGAFFPVPMRPYAPNEMIEIGANRSGRRGWRGVFFTMSSAIAVVNSIVAGSGIAFACVLLGADESFSVSIAAASSVVLTIVHGLYQLHRYRRLQLDESRTSERHRSHTIPRTEEQR